MARGLDELSVSDGTGEAVIANIESDRAISAITLDVDSVDNWPGKVILATGDKVLASNGSYYIDPSSMTIMYGHLDSGDILIDGFAPGYTDSGNTSGQIAIIKPNTYWTDEIVALAQVTHDNDGKLKVDAPITGGSTLADGWLSAEETWSYDGWTAGTRTGTITVPTNATTKYTNGMRIKITQSTGGTKYGIITKVAATLLTIFFPTGTTLNSETISTPFYSSVKVPIGFNAEPSLWELTSTVASFSNNIGATQNYYNASGLNITVPPGAWDLSFSVIAGQSQTAASLQAMRVGLSTSASSATDDDLLFGYIVRTDSTAVSGICMTRRKNISVTSDTIYYFVYNIEAGAGTITFRLIPSYGSHRTTARCGYL